MAQTFLKSMPIPYFNCNSFSLMLSITVHLLSILFIPGKKNIVRSRAWRQQKAGNCRIGFAKDKENKGTTAGYEKYRKSGGENVFFGGEY
jgi:hypothetical protein